MSQNTSHAVMAQRVEAHDSLDDFPTQPWATRALCEHVLQWDDLKTDTVWEPACNRGHMAKPLKEYFKRVFTSDIHDYSAESVDFCQDRVVDFLWPDSESTAIKAQGVDWIVTNPPFRLATEFIDRAFHLNPRWGVAIIARTSFLESVDRYRNLFSVRPPSIVAQFSERVPMVKGRLTATGSTATAYCWLVWLMGKPAHTRLVWIPPCRQKLERPGDYPPPQRPAGITEPGGNNS